VVGAHAKHAPARVYPDQSRLCTRHSSGDFPANTACRVTNITRAPIFPPIYRVVRAVTHMPARTGEVALLDWLHRHRVARSGDPHIGVITSRHHECARESRTTGGGRIRVYADVPTVAGRRARITLAGNVPGTPGRDEKGDVMILNQKRRFPRWALYLGLCAVPGAFLVIPLAWWLDRRRSRAPAKISGITHRT
jgi:hypothetical protein